MHDLFFGTGIAHSIMLFAFVIAAGLYLGKFKIKGISIGATWILFVGIILGHFGFKTDPGVLVFMKEFGLILFVFSIGLQVGPSFFQSFKEGGVMLNVLAVCLVLLAMGMVYVIHWVTGEDLRTMTGVMSGAVTNTPGLGAAQQTLSDCIIASGGTSAEAATESGNLASAYAVAYPFGVLGLIILLIIFKAVFKIDLDREKEELDKQSGNEDAARRVYCHVENPVVFNRTVADVSTELQGLMVISRLMRNGRVILPQPDTVIEEGDKLLVVTSQSDADAVKVAFGSEISMHLNDWLEADGNHVIKNLIITKSGVTGKTLKSLNVRRIFGVTVTRVVRAGISLVAGPNLRLKVGDTLSVVGSREGIDELALVVGNKKAELNHPNLIPIFFGIVLGVVFGSIPIMIPGIPYPIKLGLAGGPLIIAILLSYFGPKLGITTYTTNSANMMIREIGISFFMAAVGLGAGENFVDSIVNGGYRWILYGAIITVVPFTIIFLIARLVCKLNFYQICGLITGGTTNPPVLAFAQNEFGTDYTSVNYATVYPLTMFMRVLVAQVLILLAM